MQQQPQHEKVKDGNDTEELQKKQELIFNQDLYFIGLKCVLQQNL